MSGFIHTRACSGNAHLRRSVVVVTTMAVSPLLRRYAITYRQYLIFVEATDKARSCELRVLADADTQRQQSFALLEPKHQQAVADIAGMECDFADMESVSKCVIQHAKLWDDIETNNTIIPFDFVQYIEYRTDSTAYWQLLEATYAIFANDVEQSKILFTAVLAAYDAIPPDIQRTVPSPFPLKTRDTHVHNYVTAVRSLLSPHLL